MLLNNAQHNVLLRAWQSIPIKLLFTINPMYKGKLQSTQGTQNLNKLKSQLIKKTITSALKSPLQVKTEKNTLVN